MTLPDERYAAVLRTRTLLANLVNPNHTPRVPKLVRQEALYCLRHFPDVVDMRMAANSAPEVFQEKMEPVYRMIRQYEEEQEHEPRT